jgi:hypothetical protein
MKELLEELKECELDAKEYLEEYLKNNEEAQQHFPTIEDYDNVVSDLGSEMFYVRIYDLAVYNICKRLREKYDG